MSFLKNVGNAYGTQPDVLDFDCVAGEASITQYAVVYLDRTAATKTPNATDSIWASVKLSPTAAPVCGIFGVTQEAQATSGGRVRVRFAGQTLCQAVSATYVAGTHAVIPVSGGTAGKLSVSPATHTLQMPVGIIDTGGSSVTQITITLDGNISRAGFFTPYTP